MDVPPRIGWISRAVFRLLRGVQAGWIGDGMGIPLGFPARAALRGPRLAEPADKFVAPPHLEPRRLFRLFLGFGSAHGMEDGISLVKTALGSGCLGAYHFSRRP